MRRMRAIVVAVDLRARVFAQPGQVRVSLTEKFFRQHALRDAVLARHDHNFISRAIQQAYGIEGVRKGLQALEAIEVSDVLDHRSVTIDKDSGVAHTGLSSRNRRTAS